MPQPILGPKHRETLDLGRQAYNMKSTEVPTPGWESIGRRLGISECRARYVAQTYRKAHGLSPLPSAKKSGSSRKRVSSTEREDFNDTLERSYDLLIAGGLTYHELGEYYGISRQAASGRIRKYCLRKGIPIPPNRDRDRNFYRKEAQMAELYKRIASGSVGWSEVFAQGVGFVGLRSYAQRHDLPWPVSPHSPKALLDEGTQRLAYECRLSGLSWEECAQRLQEVFGKNPKFPTQYACSRAAKYAKRLGLDWPIKPIKPLSHL